MMSLLGPLVEVRRIGTGPVIHEGMDQRMHERGRVSEGVGHYTNINGPSVIRVPSWVRGPPLARYYMYFAHHKGSYIRMAYSDAVGGPWTVYKPGVLAIADSGFPTVRPKDDDPDRVKTEAELAGSDELRPHVASPDCIVDDENRRLVLLFHGLEGKPQASTQLSRVATSIDGVTWSVEPGTIGRPYMRGFRAPSILGNDWFSLSMPGNFYRSTSGGMPPWTVRETRQTCGKRYLFTPKMRHSAVLVRDDELWVFWTRVGDAPERILLSRVALSADWADWALLPPPLNAKGGCSGGGMMEIEVLRPELEWEGASIPPEPSKRGE